MARIQPAVEAVKGFKPEEGNSANKEFVEKVCEEKGRQTIANIRKGSPVLAEMEASGQKRTVGGIYSLVIGKVTLLKYKADPGLVAEPLDLTRILAAGYHGERWILMPGNSCR